MRNTRINGFTLLELLIVIVIVSLLLAIVIGGSHYMRKKSYEAKTLAILDAIKVGLTNYYDEFKDYPPSESSLKVYYEGDSLKDVHRVFLVESKPSEFGGSFKEIELSGNTLLACILTKQVIYRHPQDYGDKSIPPSERKDRWYKKLGPLPGCEKLRVKISDSLPIFVDAWGQPLQYKFPGDPSRSGENFYDLWSIGYDGENDTQGEDKNGKNDDIGNWMRK